MTRTHDAAVQVATLRANFNEAHTRIGAVSSSLRDQWQTSVALQGSTSILKDVQAAVVEHRALQAVLTKQDWPAAVPPLLRLGNKCGPVT